MPARRPGHTRRTLRRMVTMAPALARIRMLRCMRPTQMLRPAPAATRVLLQRQVGVMLVTAWAAAVRVSTGARARQAGVAAAHAAVAPRALWRTQLARCAVYKRPGSWRCCSGSYLCSTRPCSAARGRCVATPLFAVPARVPARSACRLTLSESRTRDVTGGGSQQRRGGRGSRGAHA